MKKTKPQPPESKFKQALTAVLTNNGWCLPESRALEVMDEHIRRLEKEIETLTGGRSAGPQRVNALEKKAPS